MAAGRVSAWLLALAATAAPAPASAAESAAAFPDSRAAAFAQAGFSTASPHMSGGEAGGSLLFHLGRRGRLALEGSGAYLDRGTGASAASLSGSLLLHLSSLDQQAVPYLAAGVGLYRTSFDTRNGRFSGPAPSGEMVAGRFRHVMKPGPPGWNLGELPLFYGDRVEDVIARTGRRGVQSFSDPALSLGAGMRIRLGRRWSLRQDARAQLVMRNGAVYPVGAFTLQLGRRF